MTPKELQDLHARLAHMEQQRRHDQGTLQRSARLARLSWACVLAVLALSLVVNLRLPVYAQSPGTSLAALVAAVKSLQTSVSSIQAKQTADEATITSQGNTITSQGNAIK